MNQLVDMDLVGSSILFQNEEDERDQREFKIHYVQHVGDLTYVVLVPLHAEGVAEVPALVTRLVVKKDQVVPQEIEDPQEFERVVGLVKDALQEESSG